MVSPPPSRRDDRSGRGTGRQARAVTVRRTAPLLVVLAVLLLASPSPALAAPANIDSFTYTSEPVDQRDGVVYFWASQEHEFQVNVAGDPATEYEVCLDRSTEDGTDRLTCTNVTTNADGTANATLLVDQWPKDTWGEQTVTASVSDGSETQATKELAVFVAAQQGDADDDGLTNQAEVDAGTAMAAADTDGDGLEDGAELNKHETDPTKADSDGDGLSDGVEVNEHETNPMKADTDGDGLPDGEEVNVLQTNPTKADTDDDGLTDGEEVNVHSTDPTKADTDEDGLPDGKEVNVYETDPTVKDTDDDGLSDAEEVNQSGTNPTKADTDDDGLGDGVEVNKYNTNPNEADSDGDGVGDKEEIERGTNPRDDVLFPVGLLPGWLPYPALIIGALMALLVGAAFVGRRVRRDRKPVHPDGSDESGDGPPATSAESVEPTSPTDASTGGDASPQADVDSGLTATEEGTAAAYLTDEERVLEMLRESGGRLPQSAVVEETDWSKSKVSRLLSSMADEGQLRKIDLGGRNLITLPEAVPESAKSRDERDEP